MNETLEGIASQRVVERLENLQVNRSDLLLQPLYLEVTNVNDGVLVVHVNQLDTYDRRLVDSSLVVSRAVGQFEVSVHAPSVLATLANFCWSVSLSPTL